MDAALDGQKIEKICEIINKNSEVISFHELKTRKAPNIKLFKRSFGFLSYNFSFKRS